MEILALKTNLINQNNYNLNKQTPELVGSLIIYPIGFTPDKYLPCDGFVLKIIDYEQLYSVIGSKFNDGTEAEDEFRLPDYNISKRFLQPGSSVGSKIAAGIPDHTHTVTAFWWDSSGVAEEGRGNPDYGHHRVLTTSKASANNSIYGKSTTVQPPSQIVHICIKYK
jgi:phage tail collar domain|nr:MAG TPA: tail collar domain [Caudoviricetes sp.]